MKEIEFDHCGIPDTVIELISFLTKEPKEWIIKQKYWQQDLTPPKVPEKVVEVLPPSLTPSVYSILQDSNDVTEDVNVDVDVIDEEEEEDTTNYS